MKNESIVLVAVCALVIGVYAFAAHSGLLASTSLNADEDYYNLLVQGFRAGQLSLKKEVPPGLARLADPYDPRANTPYEALDMSYYKGRFFLYFGVTPAVVLFWPCVALTGHHLSQKDGGVIFCAIGFLASVGLLCALWRRYFAEVSVAVVAAGALALGLATFTPLLLARCDVYEVSISCGYALTMLSLGAIWCASREPERRWQWLAAASAAYGLAVGARPSLLFGAIILLAPVVQARREGRQMGALLLVATGPIVLIGLGLMLYNALRFGNPFEFGQHYQLAGEQQVTRQMFGLRYLWFNFRVFFLEPAHWSTRFPFVHDITVPPVPVGHGRVEHPFGVLTNIPLVWLALAVPLAWRGRSADARSTLCGFLAAVAVLFGICTLTLGLYYGASTRYEVEFAPTLVLLAVVGILGLERALAPASESELAWRPVWRRAARCGWGLMLGVSVAFNLLASTEYCADAHNNLGGVLQKQGKVPEAIVQFEQAVRLNPDYAEMHNNLGAALVQAGRTTEAIEQYEQALRINPDFTEAHNNLGNVLTQLSSLPEAIEHLQQALRIKPDYPEAHNNLGIALARAGRITEAIEQYKQALRIKPGLAEAHNSLGAALFQTGRSEEAIEHFQQALRIKPDYAAAHANLGVALAQTGKNEDAIAHFEQALRIKPDYAEAHYNLGGILAQSGRIPEAIEQYEQALRFNPDFAEAHYNLGNALEQAGRVPEAIQHYEQALKLRPDFTPARNALTRLETRQ